MSPAVEIGHETTSHIVLLVEDEVLVRMLLAEELRDAGWTVVEAATGDEAWSFLRSGGTAQLLFTDLTMPGNLDGLALTRLVRSTYPAMKIILTSGNMGPRSVTGFDGYLPKPYSLAGAVAAVGKLLEPKDSGTAYPEAT
jgi:CheY-like chemotaxis protein